MNEVISLKNKTKREGETDRQTDRDKEIKLNIV